MLFAAYALSLHESHRNNDYLAGIMDTNGFVI